MCVCKIKLSWDSSGSKALLKGTIDLSVMQNKVQHSVVQLRDKGLKAQFNLKLITFLD